MKRGEKQLQALRVIWRGFAVSDVLLALTGYGLVMQKIISSESERGVAVPPGKQLTSMLVLLVLAFVFEAAYQVNLAYMVGLPWHPERVPLFDQLKRLVALPFAFWMISATVRSLGRLACLFRPD